MIDSKEKLWKGLRDQYNLKNIFSLNIKDPQIFNYSQTKAYNIFNFHLNRALLIYPEILQKEKESKDSYIFNTFEHSLPYEILNVLFITALENYLNEQFRNLASFLKVDEMSKKDLIRLIKKLRIRKEFFNALENYGNLKFTIDEILPSLINFQNHNIIKICFKSLNINVYKLDKVLWEKIFTNEDSYMQIRHKIVHKGFISTMKFQNLMSLDFIEECIYEISEFVYNIEKVVLERYPENKYQELYLNKEKMKERHNYSRSLS